MPIHSIGWWLFTTEYFSWILLLIYFRFLHSPRLVFLKLLFGGISGGNGVSFSQPFKVFKQGFLPWMPQLTSGSGHFLSGVTMKPGSTCLCGNGPTATYNRLFRGAWKPLHDFFFFFIRHCCTVCPLWVYLCRETHVWIKNRGSYSSPF